MKAEREHRIDADEGGQFPLGSVVIALLLVIAVVVAWFTLGEPSEPEVAPVGIVEETTEVVSVEPEPAALPPAPDIPEPEPEPEVLDAPEQPQGLQLPALEDSDAEIRSAYGAVTSAAQFQGMLRSENLAQRSTAMIDGFSRGLVLNKVLPVPRVEGAFSIVDAGDRLYMSPDGFARFDRVTRSVTSIDVALLAEVFHIYRDLFEESYSELGYPAEDFDNAVIRALDQILATPEIDQLILLERKKVFYSFADPDLEDLPDLQKQMMRIGVDNLRAVKAWVRQLRSELLAP